MFYTSYFAVAKRLPKDMVQVSISRFPPKGYKGWKLTRLSPTPNILYKWKQYHDEAQYIEEYTRDVLSQFDPHRLARHFHESFPGKDICFLCFEKPEDFCHRHLVAKWFEEAGIPVREWDPSQNGDQIDMFNEL